ncbi:response regulator [Caballeronia sp. Sq4a]|uniref:response regulator n=1 Tax=Caballeronia sp. Sq4a TaxID=2878152 RepID=UPI00352D97D2
MQMTRPTHAVRRWTSRTFLARGRSPRVLVVDDNSGGADALAAYLAMVKHKVAAVYGGAAAIAAACVWKPDVVVLDISMPRIDGFAVARALRTNLRTATAVIVALTAHAEDFVAKRSSHTDFDAYCQKGLMLDALPSLLSSFMRDAPA